MNAPSSRARLNGFLSRYADDWNVHKLADQRTHIHTTENDKREPRKLTKETQRPPTPSVKPTYIKELQIH